MLSEVPSTNAFWRTAPSERRSLRAICRAGAFLAQRFQLTDVTLSPLAPSDSFAAILTISCQITILQIVPARSSLSGLAEKTPRWRGYFGFCETPSVLRELDQWTRRRLRAIAWKQWKRGRTRFAELRRRGVGRDLAAQSVGSPHGPWRLSNSPALAIALPNAFFASLGLASVAVRQEP